MAHKLMAPSMRVIVEKPHFLGWRLLFSNIFKGKTINQNNSAWNIWSVFANLNKKNEVRKARKKLRLANMEAEVHVWWHHLFNAFGIDINLWTI